MNVSAADPRNSWLGGSFILGCQSSHTLQLVLHDDDLLSHPTALHYAVMLSIELNLLFIIFFHHFVVNKDFR